MYTLTLFRCERDAAGFLIGPQVLHLVCRSESDFRLKTGECVSSMLNSKGLALFVSGPNFASYHVCHI